jgi:hypothetical protein
MLGSVAGAPLMSVSGSVPGGSNCVTICSYLTRTSSLVSYHLRSSFHGSMMSL